MPHSSPRSLGCPQWAPSQDGGHTYLCLLWLLASALGIGWTPSFRHLRRLWLDRREEAFWTALPPFCLSPSLSQNARLKLNLPPAEGLRGPEASRRTQSWPWDVGASPAQACSRLPAASSASPSLPESSTAAAHTSKLIKAKGLINRCIEHFSRYGDFCGFSANLMPEPRTTSSPPAPSPPTPVVLPPPNMCPGHPFWAGRSTQPAPRRKQRPCRLKSLVALSAGGRG